MENQDNTGFIQEDGTISNVEYGAQLEQGASLSVEDKAEFIARAVKSGVPLEQAKNMFK